jgi:NAD(P)-dependent dehydrogenase (short-subunit alcohol dehydrogenase family)
MTEVSLRGRTALITGARKRLGRATALALASEGVNIVVHHRDSGEDVSEVVEEIRRRGAQAWTAAADLEKPAEYETLIERARAAAGSLDILINNASIFPPGTLEEMSFDELVRNARINAWVPFVLSRDFARLVGRGKIVNMLDSRITGYDRLHTAYLLSKHLLAQLTRMTAREFAPAITVNAVAPGLILPP